MSEYNHARPLIMHIDLNSCFATVEQQARPLLRGKPVGIANRGSEFTALVTASYEAKAFGIKVGMRVREARALCPDLIIVESDPAKYRYIYHRLLDIMREYSSHVTMKSIDEGVIDFNYATEAMLQRDLVEIGYEIKQRLKDEIGVWMRCNIGIATNRFLAKTAASLHKPDGLDIITPDNVRQVMATLKLTDLTGIASRNQKRLNAVGIFTPLEFLAASPVTLQKMVFKSVVGKWWFDRLRGWEVDDVSSDVKRVGRQYVLERFDLTYDEILQRLHDLCESVGWRLRSQKKAARQVSVYAKSRSAGYWHASCLTTLPFYSNQTIYQLALQLFQKAPDDIKEIGIHVAHLQPMEVPQVSLFHDEMMRQRAVVEAMDDINRRYGEGMVRSAHSLGAGRVVRQKIPFGSTRYL